MYNRYIPQPDGSYRRNRTESPAPPAPPRCPKEPEPCRQPPQPPCPPPCPPDRDPRPPQDHKDGSAAGFLQQLLPKNFDTGDLIVILLLLLLAGDCEEDRSNALLTLVLYLFM